MTAEQPHALRPVDLNAIAIRKGVSSTVLAAACYQCGWEMNFSTENLMTIVETCQSHECRRTTHEAMAEELRQFGWTVTR